jgi:hypothetical protein
MRKLSVALIIGVSSFFGASLYFPAYSNSYHFLSTFPKKSTLDIARTYQSKVIVEDLKASRCSQIEKDTLVQKCWGFRLTKIISDNDSSIFEIRFMFERTDLIFAIPNKIIRTNENNGKTYNIYPVDTRIVQFSETRRIPSKDEKSICIMTSDFSKITCGSREQMFSYYR